MNVAELETHNSSRQVAHVAIANLGAKRIALRRWRAFAQEQKLYLLRTSLSILSGGLLHWAMRQWRENALAQRRLRARHRQLAARMLSRELWGVWNAWCSFVYDQRAKKRALLRFSSSIVAKCWLRWKQYHIEIQRLRTVSIRIAARLTQRQVVRAVETWHDFAIEQIDQRQRLRRALAFFTNATLVRTFVAWRDFAARARETRLRWQARMTNEHLHFAWTQWQSYLQARWELHAAATRLQAFWRGILCRRWTEDHYFMLVWATILIQTAWRGRLARILMRAATRKARLREYLRAEREREAMHQEEVNRRRYDRDIVCIVTVQRLWRGTAARHLFDEVRRARYVQRKQLEAEQQEVVRAEARRRQLERVKKEQARQLAAIQIQRHIRGYLARKWFAGQRELLRQSRVAVRLQAVYRGRMSRRRTAALRRCYLTRMEIIARRAVEGKVLRAVGAPTRPHQRPLRALLSIFGLEPESFLLDIRAVFREVKEDWQALRKFFDVVKAKVHTKQPEKIEAANEGPSLRPTGVSRLGQAVNRTSPLRLAQKANSAKAFLQDLEQIVVATEGEQNAEKDMVKAGDAVRIVLRGHPRCGETAYVLSLSDEMAQVKLDVDGELEFFPLTLPATKTDAPRRVLHKVPDLAFHAASMLRVTNRITPEWRAALEAYASSIEAEAKRYNAARVIQCAARVYLARLRVLEERERQGINAARRQAAMLRVLSTFRNANTRIANILVHLRLLREIHVPRGLADQPLEIQIVANRFQRWLARRREVHDAYLRLLPVQFKGNPSSAFHGQMMPVPPVRVVDRLVFYPLQWLQRLTRVPLARLVEKSGDAELARLLGGVEFVKTFEERHVDAREHFFDQLALCRFCPSEGWAIVHGVFQKRRLLTSVSNRSILKRNKAQLRKVPHGWGVAHFLTGRGRHEAAKLVGAQLDRSPIQIASNR
ncbi:hypothetical protein PINS_up015677 [Pythium insidiosum]|nr:hypothetical protein PINS_up015677 [Pythium insidiosum]